MYLYDASALGLGGGVSGPQKMDIEAQATATLPITGGYQTSRAQNFNFRGLVSFDVAHVAVGGSYDELHDSHVTFASSTIEGLDIAGIVTADRIVSRLTIYSAGDQQGQLEPSFSNVGSYFENLRIGGHRIEIPLRNDLFQQYDTFPRINDAYQQGKLGDWLLGGNIDLARLKESDINYERLNAIASGFQKWKATSKQPERTFWCSIVDHSQLQSVLHGSELVNFGGIICVPRFGVIFLGELLVGRTQRHFNMLRLDLTPASTGSFVAGSTRGTGSHGAWSLADSRQRSQVRIAEVQQLRTASNPDASEKRFMNTEKSSGLNLIPKQLPNESLLGDFARDSTFRRTLQPLSDAQRRAILWTAALQTSFIQQQVERKIDGFRFASVGFADPETEEDAFGVFAYTLPLFDEERRLVLRADGREFPIFVRPAFEELHSLPNVHPLAGTSTCWAKSSKSGVQAEVLLLTAKHVVAHATAPAEPVVGSPVPTTYGTGRVVGLAPGSIDAVLVRLPTGIHGQIGKSLEYLQYIALWTDVHFQGMGSRKTVNTKITEVWFRGPDPSLPARVFLAWPGEHGDSGALVLDSDGKGIGIYIGGWVNIATSRMEGFCQHLGQAADVLGCNLFQ